MTVPVSRLDQHLRSCLPDPGQVRTDIADIRAAAHDASHVLLHPQAVVVPHSTGDVARLLWSASNTGFGVTFRSGGTSLSGQSGTDKVLADVRSHFSEVTVLDSGARVRVQPGVTVDRVNAHLAPYGTKIGPDPASSRACTVGGVIANNSSGMACGTVENTYATLESVVAVLASGTVLNTGSTDADDVLRLLEPELYEGLIRLRDRVRGNPRSLEIIAQQFSMKNTMGYGVNSFVDFTSPIDILTHLLVGSEGTLAFIAEAVFRTVPVRPFVGTALVVFDDLFTANSALPDLVESGAATLELMDAASLRVGQSIGGMPAEVASLRVINHAALLIEYQATSQSELDTVLVKARPALAELPVARPIELTSDAQTRTRLWGLRNGLYTTVAGARKPGTTALLEDVVVPVDALARTCSDLSKLFEEYQYPDSVIFGHAKDGNIHFMLTDRFEGKALDRYRGFTDAMVDVILGASGSLKAEHGTGRVMAPFVERQYGRELYDVMVEVKQLFDPKGILNDSVVITDDPDLHMKHIKVPVLFDADVDRCSECGYCEPVCPSRALTLTPRQRIALRREAALAKKAGDRQTVEAIKKRYTYDAVQTCAVCGMCATACPMQINTATLIKKHRKAAARGSVSRVWTTAAKHWEGTTTLASRALTTAHTLRGFSPIITAANRAGRAMIGEDTLPLWSRDLPAGGRKRARQEPQGLPDAMYLPACVNRMFGPAQGDGVQAAVEKLCSRAGVNLLVPEGIDSLCCGTPWSSKGITAGQAAMSKKVIPVLTQAAALGVPIICDASSCTEGFQKLVSQAAVDVEVIDVVQFVADRVLPLLGEYPKLASLTIHQTCSSTQIGLNPALIEVAHRVAETVNVPIATGCCAFAGDRGMLHPELTKAATGPEAAEVILLGAEVHASCNRTCELGMTRATGAPYRHILELLAERVG